TLSSVHCTAPPPLYTLSLHDALPISALRHVYLIPVAALALAFGRLGGALGAGATLVLYASVVLPALERSGLTPETIEGLVTFARSEEHTSELQSRFDLVCRLLLEKKK